MWSCRQRAHTLVTRLPALTRIPLVHAAARQARVGRHSRQPVAPVASATATAGPSLTAVAVNCYCHFYCRSQPGCRSCHHGCMPRASLVSQVASGDYDPPPLPTSAFIAIIIHSLLLLLLLFLQEQVGPLKVSNSDQWREFAREMYTGSEVGGDRLGDDPRGF